MRNGKPPEWFGKSVFYEIYPQTFFDSNGDGIGDLPGMKSKLDYIQSIGVNGIWINPCFVSPFNDAGYDVTDYYQVAPRYGTNDDLKDFVEAAHDRGIRVLLDLVPAHTSIEHSWFKASASIESNEYSSRYIWTDSVWENTGDFYLESVRGYSKRNGKYFANFFYTQPALNYGFAEPDPQRPWQLPVDHPAIESTRQDLLRIMRFWLELGVDGYRVDMAYSLVKSDPGRKKTIELWQWIRKHLDREYPDAVLVAEWHDPQEALEAHFDACFVLPFDSPGLAAFRNPEDRWSTDYSGSYFHRAGTGNLKPLVSEIESNLNSSARGYPAIAAGNHDVMRLNVDRTMPELEQIHAFTLLMPGVPFIYNGDEIGIADQTGIPSVEGGYERTSARTPMQWNDRKNAGFSEGSEQDLYSLPVRWDVNATVQVQDERADSLLNRIRAITNLVRQAPAFHADGDFHVLYGKEYMYPFVFARKSDRDAYLIVLNPSSDVASASFSLNVLGIEIEDTEHVLGCDTVSLDLREDDMTVEVPACSYAVKKLVH